MLKFSISKLCLLSIVAIFPSWGAIFSQSIFEIQNTGITPLSSSTGFFADLDNDGKLDYFASGQDSVGNRISTLYLNNSLNGTFSNSGITFPGGYQGFSSPGDVNNDGSLDIAMLFRTISGPPQTSVFMNGGASFANSASLYPSLKVGCIKWGDFDNDGDYDLAISGFDSVSNRFSGVFENSLGSFSKVSDSISGLGFSRLDWVDYDNDGDLDLILSGEQDNFQIVSKAYKNNNGHFSEDPLINNLNGISNHSTSWGDMDGDGDMDLLLGGTSTIDSAIVYENQGGTFVIYDYLQVLDGGGYQFADLDNDGDLDVFGTGDNGSVRASYLYLNNGSDFTLVASLPVEGVTGIGKIVDFNNDGILDYFVSGSGNNFQLSYLYQVSGIPANTPPTPPTSVSYTVNADSSITFQWSGAADAQTPAAGLSYSLWIGTTEHGMEITSAPADTATGFRRVVEYGQVVTNFWTLKNVSCANEYYFRVQAIDGGYMGSEFSAPVHVVLSPDGNIAQSVNTLAFTSTGAAVDSLQWVDNAGNALANGNATTYQLADTMIVGLRIFSGFCSTEIPAMVYNTVANDPSKSVSNVKIWPNPSSTVLHVRVDNPGATESVALYDMQGRIMRSITSGFNTETTFAVDDLAAGLYLVKLSLKDGRGIATATFRKD